jgi:hypothetical protein
LACGGCREIISGNTGSFSVGLLEWNKIVKSVLKQNLLAIISLLVAFSALGYNSWRNELTEQNRNVRFAGFEIIKNIGELERITYLIHFDKATIRNSPRDGWAVVLVLKDLSQLMPTDVVSRAQNLFQVWGAQWDGLGKEDLAVADIDAAINALRLETLESIRLLD